MTFSRILFRGFSAANCSVPSLMLLGMLYGWYEGAEIVISDTNGIRELLAPLGDGPPPEEVVTMGNGCLACVWLVVTVFGGPWVVAGIIGRLRDRMTGPGLATGTFAAHAEMFYAPMLVLTLTHVAVELLLAIPLGMLGMAISEMPSETGLGFVFPKALSALANNGVGLVFLFASAVVVTEYGGAIASLRTAVSCLWRHLADAAKLFVVVGALELAWWLPQQGLLLVFQQHLPILALLGVLTAVVAPYIRLLSMSWVVSLWLARRPGALEIVDLAEVELPTAADGAEGT